MNSSANPTGHSSGHPAASPAAAAAREAARRRNGEFGTQVRGEADVDLGLDSSPTTAEATESLDLSTWTPVEVDTTLAELYLAEQQARTQKSRDYESLRSFLTFNVLRRSWREPKASAEEISAHLAEADETAPAERTSHQERLLAYWDRIEEAEAAIDDIGGQRLPYEAEYRRRPWPRAFIVTNAGGHVHKSMSCSTCYPPRVDPSTGEWKPGTEFHWATEMSGASEEEIVAASGSGACTVCFPSAPLDVLSRPRSLLAPSEMEALKAKEGRAKAAQDRQAAKIAKSLTADGSPFVVEWVEERGGTDRDPVTRESTWSVRPRPASESFKTETAAMQWAVSVWVDQRIGHYAPGQPKLDAVQKIVEAVADKHGKTHQEVLDEIEKKARAKAKRDGWTPWW